MYDVCRVAVDETKKTTWMSSLQLASKGVAKKKFAHEVEKKLS